MSDTTPPTTDAATCSSTKPCKCCGSSILTLALWVALLASIASVFMACFCIIPYCLGIAFILCIILFCKGKILTGILGLIGGALSTVIIGILSVFVFPLVLIEMIAQSPEARAEIKAFFAANPSFVEDINKNPELKEAITKLNEACMTKDSCCPLIPLVPSTPSTPTTESIPATKLVPATPTTPATETVPATKLVPATPATEPIPATPITEEVDLVAIETTPSIPATPVADDDDNDDDRDDDDAPNDDLDDDKDDN